MLRFAPQVSTLTGIVIVGVNNAAAVRGAFFIGYLAEYDRRIRPSISSQFTSGEILLTSATRVDFLYAKSPFAVSAGTLMSCSARLSPDRAVVGVGRRLFDTNFFRSDNR
jgi:hypothetical protein